MDEYVLLASHEDEHNRYEMREHPSKYEAVQLRRATNGGWYIRNIITVVKEDNAEE